MTDKERDELLINIFNDVKNVKNDVKELKSNVKEIEGNMNKMQGNIKEIECNMNKIENRVNEIEKEQRNLSITVAKIEVEHGEKLQILLDVVTGQEEKNKEFERRFEEDEKILDRHSDQIIIYN